MPDSRFTVGRNCLIMQMSFINPARSVVIGDDSGIGGHCLIFGHSSFLNQFDGYAADFAPIEIGNSVGLAWRVFVLPGTTIGDGSMVGAGSVVSGTLPPRSLAVGFPARIVGKPPVFPKAVSDEEKVVMFQKIVAEMIQFLIGFGLEAEGNGCRYEIRKPAGRRGGIKKWYLQVVEGDAAAAAKNLGTTRPDVFLSLLEIPAETRDLLTAQNIVWIDVAKKEQPRISNELGDEVLDFFKRYGVRTLRYPPTKPSR
jgi:carbonic anhydrase/acetyltransferase-like protein (isoleucine patch superfamily)